MKQQRKDRISRLRGRKAELLGQMRTMRADPGVRNKQHKLGRLNDQVLTITEKIMELEHAQDH